MSKKDVNTKKGSEKEKLEKDKRSKTLQMFSVASVLILIVIALFVNIIFDVIIGDKLTFDFSATGQNSISQVTEDYLDSLPADTHVRIVGLMDRPINLKDSPYEYIVPLLDDYAAKSNGKITVEYVNPETYPSIINELDPDSMYDLTANNYVVNCNGRSTVISPIDCFSYNSEYLAYGQYLPTGNLVESTFTNAIVNLTRGYTSKAYFVTGLNNTDEHKMLSNILSGLGIDSEDLVSSDSFAIPGDCDLLIVSGINIDISESMQVAMIDYLNAGGKMIVAVDYYTNATETYPRLNAVLDFMGLAIESKVVYENDPNYVLSQDNFESIGVIIADNSPVRIQYARPITVNSMHSYVLPEGVIATSDQATTVYYDEETGQMMTFANQSQYYVGAYSTYDGMAEPPEMYVFGTTNFTSDGYIGSYGYNDPNAVYIKGVIRDLVAADDTVFVDSKPLANYSVDTTKVTSSSVTAMTFVMMVIIPLAFVITGTIVYRKRKNL